MHTEIKLKLNSKQITELKNQYLEESKKFYDDMAKIEKPTFDNFVKAIAIREGEERYMETSITMPKDVSPDKDARDASTKAAKELSDFGVDLGMREDLYLQLKKVKEAEWDKLNTLDQRLLGRMMRDFERNGLNLPEEKREKVKAVKKEMNDVCLQFMKTLGEDDTKHYFTKEQLAGLPESFIENLKTDEKTGKKIVSLKYPELVPALKNVKDPAVRKELDFSKAAQCQKENVPRFEKVIELRQQLAELLGYKDYSYYVLEVQAAKGPKLVNDFLADLRQKLTEPGKKELQNLVELKNKKEGEKSDKEIHSYDWNYYDTLFKKEQHSIDQEVIREYFPMQHVLDQSFDLAQKIYGVEFKEVKKEVWHEDVKAYEVLDGKKVIANFFLDLYPREGKYGHFAMFPMTAHYIDAEGKEKIPTVALVCNFTPPTKDKPSLLDHTQLVTFLHELGHGVHGLFSTTTYARFSGTSVVRDVVEVPSQYFEGFAWSKESLQNRFSKHYKTGKPLPDELIDQMIGAKNANIALFTLRQLFFGIFDMTVHQSGGKVDTAKLWGDLRPQVSLIDSPTNGTGGFAHLMGGYSCSYNSYLRSLVMAQDCFSVFEAEESVESPEVGMRLRKEVLSRGDEEEFDVLLENFLGRKTNSDAFLKDLGLL